MSKLDALARCALPILMAALADPVSAQAPYAAPDDPLVNEKLARWQDLKFGLLMHWGPYSQWGVVESWSICPEDEGWCQRRPEHGATYAEYVKNYEALQTTFNPVRFDPARWAKAAKEAGMKYMVFTTKHHDGFCMFDTRTTDYRITAPKTPFHAHPTANITKAVFDAFRNEGLWTGAYFSKPDWHSDDYWWRYFPPKDRSVNYDPKKHPERWQRFKDFTFAQLEELMTGYGPVDILWLDGGWVRPLSSIDTRVSWQKAITIEQDIDMARIAAMARKHQPGLLVVDRTVGGAFENYITPEGHVPDADLGVPWETCMPMGTSWSWVPNEQYKSTEEIIRTLVSVVSRGGSLLLNVAPGPDGQLDSTAYARLKEVGEWLKVNGEAVYGTRAIAGAVRPGVLGMTFALGAGEYRTTFVFVDPEAIGAGPIAIPFADANYAIKVSCLGSNEKVRSTQSEGALTLALPKNMKGMRPLPVVLKVTYLSSGF